MRYLKNELYCLRMMKYYHLIVWGTTFLLATVGAVGAGYVQTIVWCWIPPNEVILRMLTWFVPLWISITANLVIAVKIQQLLKRVIKTLPKDEYSLQLAKHYKRVTRNIIFFMVVEMTMRIPGSIHRLWRAFSGHVPHIIKFLHVLCSPSNGSCNFALYTLPSLLRSRKEKKDLEKWEVVWMKKRTLNKSDSVIPPSVQYKIKKHPVKEGSDTNSLQALQSERSNTSAHLRSPLLTATSSVSGDSLMSNLLPVPTAKIRGSFNISVSGLSCFEKNNALYSWSYHKDV